MRYRSVIALAVILPLASGCDGTAASDEVTEFSVALMGDLERSYEGDGARYTPPELIFLNTRDGGPGTLSVTLSFYGGGEEPAVGTYPVLAGGPGDVPADAPDAWFFALVVVDGGIVLQSVSGEITVTESGRVLAATGEIALAGLSDADPDDVDAQISFRAIR